MIISPIVNLEPERIRYYAADSGVDIYVPVGTSVVAAGDGEIIYSEYGHTPWVTPPDTPNSILLKLKAPLNVGGRVYPFCWYTHLSALAYQIPDDGAQHTIVKAGNYLGKTGTGNNVNHLHFGLLVNRAQAVPGDWMAPADLAALLKLVLKGVVPEAVIDTKKYLKVFYHDGKATIILPDGSDFLVKSLSLQVEI